MAENEFAGADSVPAVLAMLAGAASVCWSEIDKAGVFDSERAAYLVNQAHARITEVVLPPDISEWTIDD